MARLLEQKVSQFAIAGVTFYERVRPSLTQSFFFNLIMFQVFSASQSLTLYLNEIIECR